MNENVETGTLRMRVEGGNINSSGAVKQFSWRVCRRHLPRFIRCYNYDDAQKPLRLTSPFEA